MGLRSNITANTKESVKSRSKARSRLPTPDFRLPTSPCAKFENSNSPTRPIVKLHLLTAASALAATLAVAPAAQTKQQPQDDEYARLVKEWTTKPEFMSPLVDHLPKAAGIPSPKDVLGYYIGTPKKLTHVADINRYYRALAAATPRVKVFSAGLTDDGRECIVGAVADEDPIRNPDPHKG